MRIAQVIHNLLGGGAESLVRDLTLALTSKGHEVDVILLDKFSDDCCERKSQQALAGASIQVKSLERELKTIGLIPMLKLWWLIQHRRYDIVHSHLPMPDAIAGALHSICSHKFVHVSTVHNSRVTRGRLASYLARNRTVVYCSEPARQSQQRLDRDGFVVPNGIHIASFCNRNDDFDMTKTRKRIDVPPDSLLLIGVGYLGAQKNYECMIKTIAVLKEKVSKRDLHYVICGDGSEREKLEHLVSNCGVEDCVHFLGVRTDVVELLWAADVFVSTSISEGHPIAVLEALASGIPCVLSPIEEHVEFVRYIPGCMLASQNTPEEVAAAILRTVKSLSQCRTDLINQRMPYLSNYSIERCAESYERIYFKLTKKSKR